MPRTKEGWDIGKKNLENMGKRTSNRLHVSYFSVCNYQYGKYRKIREEYNYNDKWGEILFAKGND